MSDEDRRVAIMTSVGELRGRDAIYLDRVTHSLSPSLLKLAGQLNARLCTGYSGERQWLAYELEFRNVAAYTCCLLDLYKDERRIESSLDIVPNSHWLEGLPASGAIHYVVATYDYVYEVSATGLELRVLADGA